MEPSVGVRYLVVGGTVVVDEGKIVPDVFPGRALLGPRKRSQTSMFQALGGGWWNRPDVPKN
jgi:hypothetical protein